MVSRSDTAVGVTELTAALKRTLKARGMTYAALAAALELSEASVKRLFSERSFTLRRLESICSVLGLDFVELAQLAREPDAGKSRLTLAQERGLAAQPKLLLVFHLLVSDWTVPDILARYDISPAEWQRIRRALEKLGLASFHPNEAVTLRVSKRIVWRKDGPVRRAYHAMVLDEFFTGGFGGARAELQFEGRELSAASIELMKRKLDRLVQEFNDLAEVDSTMKPSERTSVGMIVALRPYTLSLFTRYKRARG
jgi:transcriptional regulator with XRE-family HTH domain